MNERVTMEALAERLAMMGFVIAPHGDHVGVRLSLWTSVRVHVREGRLTVDPFFGAIPRTRATLFKTLGVSAFAFASLMPGSTLPTGIAGVFLALALWGYDALRYTVTESCMAQVRQAYNALLAESATAAVNAARTFEETRALDAGAPVYGRQEARVHTPVK